MTLDTIYEQNDTRRLSLTVVIADVIYGDVSDLSWRFEVGRVPTATISCGNQHAPSYHDDVTIEVGFDGVVQRVFTGVVFDISRNEQGLSIECVGKSWVLDVEYKTQVEVLNNVDATAAVEAMLTDAGVESFVVTLQAWQLAVTRTRELNFQTYAEAIQKISEVLLARWFETASGQVLVRTAQPLPGLNATRAYFAVTPFYGGEMYPEGITSGRPRIRSLTLRTGTREVKNQIVVLGSSVTTIDSSGAEVSQRLTATVLGPNMLVLGPDDSQAYNALVFSNELIETQAKVDEFAVQMFQLHSRLATHLDLTIDGDPRVRIGETVQVEDPGFTGATGRWWVEAVANSIGQGGWQTQLTLMQREGATTNWLPVADFSVSIDREYIGDRFWLVLTFDGRLSYDFDGTIVSYSWTDNQAPPVVTGTDSVIRIRVDPTTIVGNWDVTLTVTDDAGATSAVSRTVPTSALTAAVRTPAFVAAFDVAGSVSPDGGQFWYDWTSAAVISAASSPNVPGRAVFGTTAGAIYVTANLLQTSASLALAAIGSPIVDIEWDRATLSRVWALAYNGRVYVSNNYGQTWSQHSDLRLGGAARFFNRLDSVFIGSSLALRAYGGTGTGRPCIMWTLVPSTVWTEVAIGGELLEDLTT